jgi:hypothetical protein
MQANVGRQHFIVAHMLEYYIQEASLNGVIV